MCCLGVLTVVLLGSLYARVGRTAQRALPCGGLKPEDRIKLKLYMSSAYSCRDVLLEKLRMAIAHRHDGLLNK